MDGAGWPDGSRTTPSTLESATECIEKSTPARSSPSVSVRTIARDGSAVPGKYTGANPTGGPGGGGVPVGGRVAVDDAAAVDVASARAHSISACVTTGAFELADAVAETTYSPAGRP